MRQMGLYARVKPPDYLFVQVTAADCHRLLEIGNPILHLQVVPGVIDKHLAISGEC
jgi:hypothetical protein